MATSYPHDRFDDLPDDLQRVGAHRAPAKKGRGWITFAWAALATLVLVGAGLFALSTVGGDSKLPSLFQPSATTSSTPSVKPIPTVPPKLDASVPINILNGTATPGLAKAAGDNLVAQGWAGAADGIGSRTNAATQDIKKTTVYYSAATDEGAARALVISLKADGLVLSNAYPARITVVLGSDYKLPK
jgi:hypothetical protein